MSNFLSVFVALAVSVGAFIYGLMLTWSAPIAEEIVENFEYPFWVTRESFGWITGIMALGGAFSSLISGYMRSIIGTKLTIICFCLPIIIGHFVIIYASNINMLLIGRFMAGLSIGCFGNISALYIGEIAPKKTRGALLSLFQIELNFGILFIFSLGYFVSMTTLNLVCAVIPLFYAIIFSFLPESPSMLLLKKQEEEAIRVMKSLRKNSYDYLSEIDCLRNQNKEVNKSIIEVLKVKSTRKSFIIILLVFFFFQMTGINVVLFYSTTIFKSSGVDIDPGVSSIILGLISFFSSILSSLFIDRFGRRILICSAYFLVFIGLSSEGSFFILRELNFDTSNFQWLPLTSLCTFIFAFDFGISPVSFALFGEIFTDEAKKFVAPICQAFSFILTFILGMNFPLLIELIGIGFTFLLFAFFSFCGFIFVFTYVPETKGKSREQIFEMLK